MSTDKPRILMFAPFCYPPASAESIVTAKLLLAFLDAGWEIDVIAQADSGQFYPYDIKGIWEPIAEITKNIDVSKGFRIFDKLPNSKLKRTLSRTQSLIWVAKAVYAARCLSAKKKYDFMLSRVAPQYGHLPALIISKEFNIPWIANWSDPMPPQKAPQPYGRGPTAQIPYLLNKYYMEISRKASWHTFPSERLRRYFCYYMPNITNNSSVIPHVALDGVERKNPSNTESFILCHIGGLGLRNPKTFLEGVKLFLQQTKVNSYFYVKFVGLESDAIREIAINLGIGKLISIEGAKSYEDSLTIAETSTVMVIIEAPCEEGIFFPSKFVDFVQSGKPILAVSPKVGMLSDILSSNGGGIAVDCKSPGKIAEAINILYLKWQRGTLNENFGSNRLFNLFNEQKVLEEYKKLFGILGS